MVMDGIRRLEAVPDHGESDLARDAVETGFTILLEIWLSALGELVAELPPEQLRVLLIVSHAGRVSTGRLAEALGVAVPAACRICGRMEVAGLLGHSPGAAGGVSMITLSASGRRVVAQIGAQRRAVLDHVLQSLTPAGRASLASALAEFAADPA